MIRASQIHRLRQCPGSFKAEQGLLESTTSYSETGTRIHKMLETSKFDGATKEEMEILTDMIRMKTSVEEDILGECKRPFRIFREREVYVFDFDGAKRVSGHPDEVILAEHPTIGWIALVEDVKTGFLEVDSAEENEQLRVYALGIPALTGVDVNKVYGKIIQRFFKHNVVEYDVEALAAARVSILEIVHEAEKPDAKRAPSESACRYCKALGTVRCPETAGIVELVKGDQLLVDAYSPEQMAQRLELFSVAENLIEKEKMAFKARLEKDPSAIPGYYLKPGNTRSSIPDSQAAYNQLEDVLTLDQFQSSLTVNVGKLQDIVGEATGLKGKALDERFEKLLAGVLRTSQNAPSLSKMSKALLKEKGL